MIMKRGSIFESDLPILVHGVNARGVMGAGVALEMARRYPEVYRAYRKLYNKNELKPGTCLMVTAEDKKLIGNLVTQVNYGGQGKYANHEYIARALDDLLCCVREQFQGPLEIASPKIGCGYGGLRWEQDVKMLFLEQEKKNDVEFTIYSYNP